MKTKLGFLFALAALLFISSNAFAQGTTAFTYQGQLRDGGTNANGTYSMTFKLYDTVSGGNQIGGSLSSSPSLVNGLFSVNLDFGAGAFDGSVRWLDITVQATRGDTTSYTLTPRAQVLPSPYALYAAIAATVTNGAIMNAQLAGNSVATTNIQNNAVTATQIADGAVTNRNLAANAVTNPKLAANAVNATNIASGNVVKSLNGLNDVVTLLAGTNVVLTTNGNSLQISGDASLLAGAQNNLRIIAGGLNRDGSVAGGAGFTSFLGGNGVYTINFNTAFSTPPAVAVTPFSRETVATLSIFTLGTSGFSIVPTTPILNMMTNTNGVVSADKIIHVNAVAVAGGGGFTFIAVGPK